MIEKSCSNCRHGQGAEDEGACMEPGAGLCDEFTYELWEPIEGDASPAKDPKSRYYDHGGIEVLDIIKAKLTSDQYKGFLLGNVIKYSCRANFKGQMNRDIEKIDFYGEELLRIIEL